jgi:hypothetical protein
MTSLPRNRLKFTLQSSSPAILKKNNVLRAFLCFGDVSYLFHKTGFTFGWAEFKPVDAYAKASNLLLPITTSTGVWELHAFKDFNMAKPFRDAFSHQILLESHQLENLIIVKVSLVFINRRFMA